MKIAHSKRISPDQHCFCFLKAVASGIHFFDVNEHGTGIYKVKVDSYMPTSQNDSSGFHAKKTFVSYFLLLFSFNQQCETQTQSYLCQCNCYWQKRERGAKQTNKFKTIFILTAKKRKCNGNFPKNIAFTCIHTCPCINN